MKTLAFLLTFAALPAAAEIRIEDAYARLARPGAPTGAAFMVIRNTGDASDRLVGVETPVAGMSELHGHVMDGDVMRMRRVDEGLEIPAGGSRELARGGDHVMLMGLDAGLADGMSFPLTLIFESAGAIRIDVPLDSARGQAGN